MERIELNISFETRDYWRFYLSYFFSSGSLFYSYIGYTIFGFCVAFLLLGGELPILGFVLIVVASALFLGLFNLAMVYFSVENVKRLNNRNCKYIFSEDNLEIITNFFRTTINWSYILGARETANYLFLPMKSGEKQFIPKRFFTDDEQLSDFKNLLRAKFGEKAALKKSKESLGLK